ncbi:MAG: lipoprotein [Gammaproteobacteria bacterium]
MGGSFRAVLRGLGRVLAVVALGLALGGCGQKGDLYHPGAASAPASRTHG